MLGCAAHRGKQPSATEKCSQEERNKRYKHSYGCNRHAHNTAQHRTEQSRAESWTRERAASKWRQPKETTIWICVWWVVTNVAFVLCSHVRFVSVLQHCCCCCFCCCCCLLSLLCYWIYSAVVRCCFPLSATTQHCMSEIVCLCLCVRANTHLCWCQCHDTNERKNETEQRRSLWIHTAHMHAYMLALYNSLVLLILISSFNSLISSRTSSDWSIQAWDLTAQ